MAGDGDGALGCAGGTRGRRGSAAGAVIGRCAAVAYRGAMPTPHGYYVLLEVEPWASPAEEASRLPMPLVGRTVLTAVASAAHMPREMLVRCFLGRCDDRYVAFCLISCGSMADARVASMYTAVLRCGLALVQWHAIMSKIEMTFFEFNMACEVAHTPVPISAVSRRGDPDAAVGFYRFADNPMSHGGGSWQRGRHRPRRGVGRADELSLLFRAATRAPRPLKAA